jgi:hypothetical protein
MQAPGNGANERVGRRERRHDRLSPLAAVPVQERLRERPDDHGVLERVTPGAVVPPLDVTVPEPVLGGALVGEVAVDVVEPRAAAVLGDLVHRAHIPAAVTRLDLGHPLESLHRGQAGRHLADMQHLRAPVACHPDGRVAGAARTGAAAGQRDREGRR